MSKHGKYQLDSPMEQRFHEKAMAARRVFRCEFCAAWAEGPARDVLLFATDHRTINHVGAVDRGQRVRQTAAKAAPISFWTGRQAMGEM